MNMRVRSTSLHPAPALANASPMISKQRRACAPASAGQDPSDHTGPVPETSTRFPARSAREKPMVGSYGEPELTRCRRSALAPGTELGAVFARCSRSMNASIIAVYAWVTTSASTPEVLAWARTRRIISARRSVAAAAAGLALSPAARMTSCCRLASKATIWSSSWSISRRMSSSDMVILPVRTAHGVLADQYLATAGLELVVHRHDPPGDVMFDDACTRVADRIRFVVDHSP